jgi:hypothetical protein
MVAVEDTIMSMSDTKQDLFGAIHKGLRAMLFATAAEVARADLRDDAQARALALSVERLHRFLADHAEHEDTLVLPMLAAHAPALARKLGDMHVEMDRLQKELVGEAARLPHVAAAERPPLGAALGSALHRLIALQLAHMDQEEREAAAVLHACCAPEELAALPAKITQSMSPERGMEVLRMMLPALNPVERAGLIASLEARLPPAAMVAILSAAEATRTPANAAAQVQS